jgi:hypothetical protein
MGQKIACARTDGGSESAEVMVAQRFAVAGIRVKEDVKGEDRCAREVPAARFLVLSGAICFSVS